MNSEINVKFEIDKTTVGLLAILAALIALVFAGSMKVDAQEVAETLRINTRVVFMDALVKDKRTGVPISDLKPENFEIYDDGNLRPVSYFTREGQARKPLALVLILDLREDGAGRFLKRPEVLKAMADELAKLSPEDEVAILAMNVNNEDEEHLWLTGFTRDRAELVAALGRAPQLVGGDPDIDIEGNVNHRNSAKSNKTGGLNKTSTDVTTTSPGQASTSPSQTSTSPSQTSTSPGQSSTSPGQASTSPGQSSASPGQTSTSPGQTSTSPSQASTSPSQASTSPSQTSVSPARETSAKSTDSLDEPSQNESASHGSGAPRSDDNVQVEVIKGKKGAVVTRTTHADGSVDVMRSNKKGDVTMEIDDIYDLSGAVRDTTRKAQAERPNSQTAIVWVSDGIAPIFFEDRDATQEMVIRSNVIFNSLTTEMRTLFKLLMPIGRPVAGMLGVSVYGSAKRLAQQSGGEALKVSRTKDYANGLAKIIGNLSARYSLGFTLAEDEKDDGRLHNLEVKVKAQDAKGKTRKLEVSARRGYYMSETGAKETKEATANAQ
jgi:VWFA-related protein